MHAAIAAAIAVTCGGTQWDAINETLQACHKNVAGEYHSALGGWQLQAVSNQVAGEEGSETLTVTKAQTRGLQRTQVSCCLPSNLVSAAAEQQRC